jgi:hypothetical protein
MAAAPEAGMAAAPPVADGAFHCFAWIHGPSFSTDCYRTEAECQAERARMEGGARPTIPCKTMVHASCAVFPDGQERCFGDAANCARYRAFVAKNGHPTGECATR